jgi:hypothetical protein
MFLPDAGAYDDRNASTMAHEGLYSRDAMGGRPWHARLVTPAATA